MIGRMMTARVEVKATPKDKDLERKTFVVRPFMVVEVRLNSPTMGGYIYFAPSDRNPEGEEFQTMEWRTLNPSVKMGNAADPDAEWSEGIVGAA